MIRKCLLKDIHNKTSYLVAKMLLIQLAFPVTKSALSIVYANGDHTPPLGINARMFMPW